MTLVICLAAALVALAGTAADASAQTVFGTIGLSQGWATFGQAVPAGLVPGGNGIQVGTLTTQTDVKNRWPDCSIRFAVVTVNVPTAGNYSLHAGPVPPGTLTPTLPTATATFVIAGATYTATLPATASADTWLAGPLAYEGRSVIAPVSAVGGTPHPFLRVVFDTRVYIDGSGRVDITAENVLDLTGASAVTYDVTLRINGTSVFTKSAVQHFYLTRWRKTFALPSSVLATTTPDLRPFNLSGALPPYLSLVTNRLDTIPNPATYEILGTGALDSDMSAHGGRGALAPYPDWTARYLVHKDPAQRAFVLANGDLAGSWPVHVREADLSATPGVGSGRFISLDQRPALWYDERARGTVDFIKGSPLPIKEYTPLCAAPPAVQDPGCQPLPAGQTRLIPDN